MLYLVFFNKTSEDAATSAHQVFEVHRWSTIFFSLSHIMGALEVTCLYLISSFYFYPCFQSFSHKNIFKSMYHKYFRSQWAGGIDCLCSFDKLDFGSISVILRAVISAKEHSTRGKKMIALAKRTVLLETEPRMRQCSVVGDLSMTLSCFSCGFSQVHTAVLVGTDSRGKIPFWT